MYSALIMYCTCCGPGACIQREIAGFFWTVIVVAKTLEVLGRPGLQQDRSQPVHSCLSHQLKSQFSCIPTSLHSSNYSKMVQLGCLGHLLQGSCSMQKPLQTSTHPPGGRKSHEQRFLRKASFQSQNQTFYDDNNS